MLRRLFFSFPEPAQARRAADEIANAGIGRWRIHCIAREGVDLKGLPSATRAQCCDQVWLWDRLVWNSMLVLIVFSAVMLFVGLFGGFTGWAMAGATLLIVSFVWGYYFAAYVPHDHLREMRSQMNHNEVLLLVDVPYKQVARIEALVRKNHPEAVDAGVGWALGAGPL